jgi:hypothetical protein
MIYPAILLFLTISMVVFMMVMIVPRIAEGFAKQNVELPWPTKVIISISEFIQHDYLIIL